MKRGGYGKPWRPPADGWGVPRKTFLGGLYQHLRPGLNGLDKYINVTSNPLQDNQVGPPVTRFAPNGSGPDTCEDHPDNGLPKIPWIGLGDNQYLLSQLPNTFTKQGTSDRGNLGLQRGFKNVQAVRQWHGAPGWLSHNSPCNDIFCVTETTDGNGAHPGDTGYVPTYTTSSYESPLGAADQTKYLTYAVNIAFSYYRGPFLNTWLSNVASASGSRTADANSGKLTSSISTTETDTTQTRTWDGSSWVLGPVYTTRNITNGVGNTYFGDGNVYQNFPSGGATVLDGICTPDVHCALPVTPMGLPFMDGSDNVSIDGVISGWNASFRPLLLDPSLFATIMGPGGGSIELMPPITDPNNYSGSATNTYNPAPGAVGSDGGLEGPSTEVLSISWSKTNTTFTWSVTYLFTPGAHVGESADNYSFTGTLTLSNANTSASVNSDRDHLLSFWPLNDDALYPPRTDGIWQVAPLMSRDEVESNVNPIGFNPYYVDDLRSPIVDINGNSPFTSPVNPPPVGWTYAPGNNASYSPATDLLGVYVPGTTVASDDSHPAQAWLPTYAQTAWLDPNAYGFRFPAGKDNGNSAASDLVQYALTGKIFGMPMPTAFSSGESALQGPGPTMTGAYENFFDYRAVIWKMCQWFDEGGGGPYADLYIWGYGEWLQDAISRTGAQLPQCATQWTNNADAMRFPAYAFLIQGDKQLYAVPGGFPGPSSDGFAAFRGDAVWGQKCMEIGELWPSQNFFRPAGADRFAFDESLVYCFDGTTLTDSSGTVQSGLTKTGIWGGQSASGFYDGFTTDGSGVVTLGTKILDVPAAWTSASGDFAYAFGQLRYPTAPAILGRDHITSLTDNHDGTVTIQLDVAEDWLLTGDAIDTCSTAITYDSNGNRVSETMSVVASNKTVTRIDATHFKITASLASLAGSVYIVAHGGPAWEWDDNGRKGDFVMLDWTFDYRTPGEIARLTGAVDCSGGSIALSPTTAGYLGFSAFNQVQHQLATGLPFKPCCEMVIAITPNGETWTNGIVLPFPATFNFDDRYGARWQMEIEQAMTDLLWQAPHTPCSGSVPTDITDTAPTGVVMEMDDGTCKASYFTYSESGSSTYHFVYAHAPLVEARITVPNYGGNSETDTAPPSPTGIGYTSPVTSSSGVQPPGMIGYDPTTGNPVGAWTFWGYRLTIEGTCPGGCRFDYVGMENLPCVTSYAPAPPAAPADSNTAEGYTAEGLT
jgi:hypothetical protein